MWPGDGVILAVGQASGRVSLVSFREVSETSDQSEASIMTMDQSQGEGKFLLDRGELSPRTSRGCSCVRWHRGPGSAAILASGYEKHRTDNAIAVWDLAQVRGL